MSHNKKKKINKRSVLGEFVVLDLETIGLDWLKGKIIELAALRIRDGQVVEEFDQLVDPGVAIPKAVTKLTGIRDVDVEAKPGIDDCLGNFLDFVGDLPLVGHNIAAFDKPFLDHVLSESRLARTFGNQVYDTLELAIFLLPELRKHSLEYLYNHLTGKRKTQSHRAKDDCLMTLEVLKKLKEVRDREWDSPWLLHVGELAKQTKWPWADLILDLEDRLELGERINTDLPVEQYLDKINWQKIEKIEDEQEGDGQKDGSEEKKNKKKEYVKVSEKEIREVFAGKSSGSLRSVLGKDYEPRKQQEDMAVKIADCINRDKNLVVEAPTGCGKSLAYLIPAVFFSVKNDNCPVVISTYTNALQDQLFESDFQLVKKLFDAKIKFTVAKGREHYVCIRRFKNYLDELLHEEEGFFEKASFQGKLFALFLANWFIRSKENCGDLDRLPFWLRKRKEEFSNSRINSSRDSCQRRFCEFYDKCFVNKLKIATRESNVIVSNHSLVFSDPWDRPDVFSVLPNGFEVLVIDEAINIESAATSASTAAFSKKDFNNLVKELFDASKPNSGFLRSTERYLQKTGDEKMADKCKRLRSTARRLLENNQALFDLVLSELGGRQNEYDKKSEIFSPFLEEASIEIENMSLALSEIIGFFDIVKNLYCEQVRNNFCHEVKKYQNSFSEYFAFLAVLKELNKSEYIFYTEIKANASDASLNFCHKDVGKYLDNSLYGKDLKSIIFTSATLTYNKSFDYINKVWGLGRIPGEKLEYLQLPYLFDYQKQSTLFLVNALPNSNYHNPSDNDVNYYPLTGRFLGDLMLANHGSSMVLFTNKKDVKKFSESLVQRLEQNNIPLCSTERSLDPRIISGSKAGIVEEFKESTESCLLGTAGLREGINVPGNSLEVVAIVRLPFKVPSDPIIKNRQQIYGGFRGYALPHSIFDIKQAFGRLIRAKNDQGFVFIIDSRVMNYQGEIKDNLPTGLNIINLYSDDFECLNQALLETKGEKNRIEKVLKILRPSI